jgi:hypothetical protein
VYPCTYRAARGITVVCGVMAECAYWWNDELSRNPDREVIRSVQRGMAAVPGGGRLVKISTPGGKSGILWDDHSKRHELPKTLVVRGSTWMFNPSVPQRFLDRRRADDPTAFRQDFEAEFQKDASAYVDREVVESCVDVSVYEGPPVNDINYSGFVDPAGGGGQDSMSLAIGHDEAGVFVLDVLREARPKFSPEAVTAEFAHQSKQYRVGKLRGDNYAGEVFAEQFAKNDVVLEKSDRSKTELYRSAWPLLNISRIRLLDNPRLLAQFSGLQRRVNRGGGDSIDHGSGAHDDLCNVVAGSAHFTVVKKKKIARAGRLLGANHTLGSFARLPGQVARWRS